MLVARYVVTSSVARAAGSGIPGAMEPAVDCQKSEEIWFDTRMIET
jgi:hypothetical protein